MVEKMRLITLLFIWAISWTFISCAKEDPYVYDVPETFGIRHDRSLSEYEALAASNDPMLPDFKPVVFFSYSLDGSPQQDFIATGTLIDEEWILTAGHNFYDAAEQNTPAPPRGITVFTGNDPNFPDATYEVSGVVYHPGWLAGDQEYSHANDLCLVRLARPITHVTPAVLYLTDDESLGSDVWFCGYGDY